LALAMVPSNSETRHRGCGFRSSRAKKEAHGAETRRAGGLRRACGGGNVAADRCARPVGCRTPPCFIDRLRQTLFVLGTDRVCRRFTASVWLAMSGVAGCRRTCHARRRDRLAQRKPNALLGRRFADGLGAGAGAASGGARGSSGISSNRTTSHCTEPIAIAASIEQLAVR
jgi:hypothetical protein